MKDILNLDINQIQNLPNFSGDSGEGNKVNEALESYCNGLINVSNNGFYSDDTSTAHGVIDALEYQVASLSETMIFIHTIIDEVIGMINSDVIEKENSISETVLED